MVIWFFLLMPLSALPCLQPSRFFPELCLSVSITVVLWLNYGLWSGSVGPCVAAALSPTDLSLSSTLAGPLSLPLHYDARSPHLPQHCPVTLDHRGRMRRGTKATPTNTDLVADSLPPTFMCVNLWEVAGMERWSCCYEACTTGEKCLLKPLHHVSTLTFP